MKKETTCEEKLAFFLDTMQLLKENALEARQERVSNLQDDFKMGVAFGYYEVLHLLKQQARAFNIPFEDIGLGNLDPERDLLGLIRDNTEKN